jgi:hypothetical protein
MVFLVDPTTVSNPAVLKTARVPKQLLGRGFGFVPRGGAATATFWRLVLEQSLTRYVIALAPFPLAMLVWPELALPISQAPILMFGLVLFIESNVLSVPTPSRRRALIDEADAARGLDLLRARARAILTRAAARRGLTEGVLNLVVEQSAMARVAPFTLLSLQYDGPGGVEVLELSPAERAALRDELFDADLPERLLQRINLCENVFLRALPLEAKSVSAHARLAALAERSPLSARG